MLDLERLKSDFITLSETDRQRVLDFVATLKQHGFAYAQAPKPLDLENSSFVGMWPDRPEMQDSIAWVRMIRQQH
ncbi:MAG: hypothetical protein GDA56_18015 [Hormoscilla sp. GM7CHS1pb]|nr:hypothetical protein [Hormoscilla sp. GM7CHS1pb]